MTYVCAQSLQLCPTLCNAMDCSPPGSSVHGILQIRILEWVAVPSFRGSSQARDWTHVSSITGGFFTTEPPGKPPYYYSMYHPAILNESQDTSQCSPEPHLRNTGWALSIDLATEKHMVSLDSLPSLCVPAPTPLLSGSYSFSQELEEQPSVAGYVGLGLWRSEYLVIPGSQEFHLFWPVVGWELCLWC